MNNQYGFNSLFGNSSQSNNSPQNTTPFIPVRVIDIILDDKNLNFQNQGGWDSIGTIQFRPIYMPANENKEVFLFAKPFFSNIKHYPLKNEIVFILFLPDKTTLNNNNGSFYYIDTINIWNSPHHNALPDIDNPNNFSENQKRDYVETSNGVARRITDNSSEIDLGKTFLEQNNIHPLLPYEGDTIIESRFGSSIRFGSTVNNSNIKNLWSSNGSNGNPIIIMSNNQNISSKEGWIPILEDINKDGSSIYVGSTQSIPIKVSSTNQKSFGITISNSNSQNIILSDTPLTSPISKSNNDIDSNIQSNTNYISSPNTLLASNNTSSANLDNFNFILDGDVSDNPASKLTEDNYYVPEDLDLSIPPNTSPDLLPSDRNKLGDFIIPAAGKITSKKAQRTDPLDPTKTEFHGGLDIANKVGTPVYAVDNGNVVRAGFSPSYGNIVIIYHQDRDLYSLYAHLSVFNVSVGQLISQGTPIGKIGVTGRSTGPHLHFEIIKGTKFGNSDFYSKNYKQDPLNYI